MITFFTVCSSSAEQVQQLAMVYLAKLWNVCIYSVGLSYGLCSCSGGLLQNVPSSWFSFFFFSVVMWREFCGFLLVCFGCAEYKLHYCIKLDAYSPLDFMAISEVILLNSSKTSVQWSFELSHAALTTIRAKVFSYWDQSGHMGFSYCSQCLYYLRNKRRVDIFSLQSFYI